MKKCLDDCCFCGHRIEMGFSAPEIGEKVRSLIHLPPPGEKAPSEAVLRADFRMDRETALETITDVPGKKLDEGTLLLGRNLYPWRRYADGRGCYWREYDGLGRQFWDLERGTYTVTVSPETVERHFPFIYLISVLSLAPILRLREVHSVHAACAVVGGRGLILSAMSGGGKSSCALALANRGYPLLTDERVFLRSAPGGGYRAASPSDVIKIHREAKERFFSSLQTDGRLGEYYGDIYFKLADSGLAFRNECTVHALCCLDKNGKTHSRWEPIPSARAVASLLPVTVPIGDPDMVQEVFGFLMKFLSSTPCFRFSMGTDMEDAVAALEDLASSL